MACGFKPRDSGLYITATVYNMMYSYPGLVPVYLLLLTISWCSGISVNHTHIFRGANTALVVEAKTSNGHELLLPKAERKFGIPKLLSFCPQSNELCCPKIPSKIETDLMKTRVSRSAPNQNDETRCGYGPYKTPKRTLGETKAVKNSWPNMVALLMDDQQFCGGSLIDSIHVITAAHCVSHISANNVSSLRVALGMHSLKPMEDPLVKKAVLRVAPHKDFNAETFYNDIALLTMESPVAFMDAISPVCLPSLGSSDQHAYQEAVTIGWGSQLQNGTQANVLRQLTILTMTNAECRSRFEDVVASGVANHMICASYPGKDVCTGDSGGPLLVQEVAGDPWIQIGIISWGIGCAEPEFPGVYTRISSFVDWIKTQILLEDLHSSEPLPNLMG